MAFTIQTPVFSGWSSGNGTVSVALTVPSNTRTLYIIGSDYRQGDGPQPFALPEICSWNGIDATLVSTPVGGNGYLQWLYKIDNPTAATGNVLFKTISTNLNRAVCAFCVTSTNVLALSGSANSSSLSATPSVTTASAVGDTVLSFLAYRGVTLAQITETAGQTIFAENEASSFSSRFIDTFTAVSTSTATTWSNSGTNNRWGAVALSINDTGVPYSEYSITSIGGDNVVEIGESTNIVTAGYASVTGLTTDTAGITVSSLGATTANSTPFTLADRIEGGLFPSLPAMVIFTATDGTNPSTRSASVTKKAAESTVTTVSMVTGDLTYLADHLVAAGRSVANGGQISWIPGDENVLVGADGGVSADNETIFNIWYRDPANGRVYEFIVTANEAGIVTVESGLTAKGLALKGLTAKGLTAVGL
jgi:hypothetical protein